MPILMCSYVVEGGRGFCDETFPFLVMVCFRVAAAQLDVGIAFKNQCVCDVFVGPV